MHLTLMLLAAFAGGLILNLMPCVLPVLSLKVFDFVQRASSPKGRGGVFAHGMAFAGGTVATFWALAGLLIALRRGGQGLGWGYQLQSPTFVVILCSLFMFFALHLFGVFEVGYLFTRVRRGHEKEGLGGSFLAGVTATLVATPCTGPFMGTAMAYAFTQNALTALLVFTALGLGMAFPYLLLAVSPGLARFLPRPGAWMENLKQFMGFPLLATVAWLAWVFGRQEGIDAMAMLLGLMVTAGLAAWILGKWMSLHHPGHVRLTALLVALAVFAPALAWVLYDVQGNTERKNAGVSSAVEVRSRPGEIAWEKFTPEVLAALRAEGRPVFIDFTADWCITCKVNERAALSKASVAAAFAAKDVAALKADWTNSDEAVTKALEGYGRNSIPLYVYYPAGSDTFKILPQVLTPGLVVNAL
jgi:thiol:disulfide interchange protein DsbD